MNRFTPYAAVVLRLAVGLVFLHHGVMKLHNGIPAMADFLHNYGLPFATICATIVIGVETIGAACVLLGILTRVWAAAMAFEMVVASLVVVVPSGRWPELEGLLCAGALALVALGDGPLSLAVGLKKGT
jgi:putative oxidoreductase